MCREVSFYATAVELRPSALLRSIAGHPGGESRFSELILDLLLMVSSPYTNKAMETVEPLDPLNVGRTHTVFEMGEKHRRFSDELRLLAIVAVGIADLRTWTSDMLSGSLTEQTAVPVPPAAIETSCVVVFLNVLVTFS